MAGAGLSSVSAHRRSLVTATAAGAVLCALWFVPTAKAAPEHPGSAAASARDAVSQTRTQSAANGAGGARTTAPLPLTDTRGIGSTPYVVGGLGFAGAGGALVIRARRRASSPRPDAR